MCSSLYVNECINQPLYILFDFQQGSKSEMQIPCSFHKLRKLKLIDWHYIVQLKNFTAFSSTNSWTRQSNSNKILESSFFCNSKKKIQKYAWTFQWIYLYLIHLVSELHVSAKIIINLTQFKISIHILAIENRPFMINVLNGGKSPVSRVPLLVNRYLLRIE